MSSPTTFLGGVNNVKKSLPLGMLGFPDPTKYHVFFDDFDRYVAADWTITEVDGGTDGAAVIGLTDGDGGLLSILTNDAENDAEHFQKVGESFLFAAGKKLWFKARFSVDEATQSDFVMGLQITDDSPLAVTHGVWFQKDDGDANLDFHVAKDSTQTNSAAIATVVADTFLEVAFYYNGKDAIEVWVDDVHKATVAVTNLPDDEALTVSFGMQTGAAGAQTMVVDYIFVAKER